MAKQNGVHTMAITDHDTVAGVAEAVRVGQELGVRVIPGIEISIQEHGMHLLGLGIDVENQALLATLKQAAENRLNAAREMVERFQSDGWTVEWEDVLREAGESAVITRPHIVGAIMKRPENKAKLEGVATKHDFFEKYFTDKSPYHVRASTITPPDAITLVHGAGGVAVWSHPPIPEFVGNCPALEIFLKELIGYGLNGLELFGPSLTEADFVCLEKLASRYDILVTAGSDFHEARPPTEEPWPRSATTIGEYPTHGRSLDGIVPSLERAMAERRRG
jgi:predicted metal-dependent phosphoesterase TrpH